MNQKRQRSMRMIWMEIGLAVLLAVALGVGGAWLTDQKTVQKETKNEQNSGEKNGVNTETQTTAAPTEETQTTAAPTDAAQTKEAPQEGAGQYPIMGDSSVTVSQMKAYFESAGVPYPAEALAKGGADTIDTFCRMYYDEAAAEGVRPEVAFVQTMKETNWLQYGGDASIGQFNFAGLGTTGGGVPGNSYPDVRTGIRAQIQHLKAYATTDVLTQECVDDRYEYVTKGSAPYVEWLGQKENPQGYGWATDENYGYSIVEMIRKMEQLPSN